MKLDYNKIGLLCGLEIHQQLDCSKLFCSCPCRLDKGKPDFTVERYLRASAGESGEFDVAALHEMRRKLHFQYQGNYETSCLVDLDEEPPQPMNKKALKNALMFAKLFDVTFVDQVQVMRKTVVNGSNTSGFQRTALIGTDGYMDKFDISIDTICVEEDACKDVGIKDNMRIFRLDRLGIPLIEIATGPDITSPKEAQEVASFIGMALRSLPDVRRGIGTIRQDVNVSISGGNRVEIKGAQDLQLLPTIVTYEAERQQSLILLSKKLEKISFPKTPRIIDVTTVFKNTQSKMLTKGFREKKKVLGMNLPHCKGIPGTELQPNKRVGTELSEYNGIIVGIKGLLHGDELPACGITEKELFAVRKKLACKNKDSFILVIAHKDEAYDALETAWERLLAFRDGVPKEVRKANPDGTSSFLRPIPGAARMYPETDVAPITLQLKNISPPTLITQVKKQLIKKGLLKDSAELLMKTGKVKLFQKIIKKYPSLKKNFVVETIVALPRELKRRYNVTIDNITDDDFILLFESLQKKKISKDMLPQLLKETAEGKNVTTLISECASEKISKKDLEAAVKKIIEKNKDAPFGALMGIAMKQLSAKASGAEISAMLKKLS